MSLANRDGRESIQEATHDLKAGLRRSVGTAGDDDRSVTRAARVPSAANPLCQATDETDGGCSAERGPVMVVYLVPETRITDLIEADELIKSARAAIWHQQAVKGHCESRLAEGLNRSRLTENAGAGGDQHVLSAV